MIDTPRYGYIVSRTVAFRRAAVTVNAPIRFAVQGTTVYVLDDAGEEFQTSLIRRTLKPGTPGEQPTGWKSTTGMDRYQVRISEDFVYAEQVLSGDNWVKFEARRAGDQYVGRMHRSVDGCLFDTEVDFSLVSFERIEGLFVSAPVSAKFDRRHCRYSLKDQIFRFTWVPE